MRRSEVSYHLKKVCTVQSILQVIVLFVVYIRQIDSQFGHGIPGLF